MKEIICENCFDVIPPEFYDAGGIDICAKCMDEMSDAELSDYINDDIPNT